MKLVLVFFATYFLFPTSSAPIPQRLPEPILVSSIRCGQSQSQNDRTEELGRQFLIDQELARRVVIISPKAKYQTTGKVGVAKVDALAVCDVP